MAKVIQIAIDPNPNPSDPSLLRVFGLTDEGALVECYPDTKHCNFWMPLHEEDIETVGPPKKR